MKTQNHVVLRSILMDGKKLDLIRGIAFVTKRGEARYNELLAFVKNNPSPVITLSATEKLVVKPDFIAITLNFSGSPVRAIESRL